MLLLLVSHSIFGEQLPSLGFNFFICELQTRPWIQHCEYRSPKHSIDLLRKLLGCGLSLGLLEQRCWVKGDRAACDKLDP